LRILQPIAIQTKTIVGIICRALLALVLVAVWMALMVYLGYVVAAVVASKQSMRSFAASHLTALR
jgi:hypothetical protein